MLQQIQVRIQCSQSQENHSDALHVEGQSLSPIFFIIGSVTRWHLRIWYWSNFFLEGALNESSSSFAFPAAVGLKMAHPKVAMHSYAEVGAHGAIVEHWIWTSGLLILDRLLMLHSSTWHGISCFISLVQGSHTWEDSTMVLLPLTKISMQLVIRHSYSDFDKLLTDSFLQLRYHVVIDLQVFSFTNNFLCFRRIKTPRIEN